MTIWGLFLLMAIVMKVWPETPAAQWLRATLIERPLDLLGRVRRRHLIFLIIGLAVMYSLAEAGMPHLALAAAIDVSAYVDALITVSAIAALNRSRGAWQALRFGLPTLRRAGPRPRRARRHAVRLEKSASANDDEGHGALAYAA